MTTQGQVLERWTARAAVTAVVGAIAVAAVRAATGGWYPIGDNALLTLRARDVLTPSHPWLGTWTSASLSVGTPINNPGPLQFDLLAPFAKVDPAAGVAIGVAVLNALAVVLMAVFARRLGGDRFVAGTMVVAGVVVYAMSTELLVDPWQPHSMLLPFLLLVVLAIALAAGDAVALPWAVGVVSLLVQTHLSYAVLGPGILLAGLVWLLLRIRPRSTDGMEPRAARSRLRRAVLVAVAVGALCWAQPLWEQVARSGNLEEVARSASGGEEVIGARSGVRLVGTVVGDPAGWTRGSFADTFRHDQLGERVAPVGPPNVGVRPLAAAAASLVATGLLLGAAVWIGRRRSQPEGTAVGVVLGAAVVLGLATSASLPASEILGIAAHQLRWLWPVGVASAVLPVVALLPRRPVVTVAASALAVAAGIAALVPSNAGAGPSGDVVARPAVLALADALGSLDADTTYYFDGQTVPFAEPFSGPLLLELQRRGIDFEVDPGALSNQVGPERLGPRDATTQIRLLVGDADAPAPAGSEVLARIDGLGAGDRARVDQLAGELRRGLAGREVRLNARGEAARRAGSAAELEAPGWGSDLGLLVDRAVLARLVAEEWVDLDSVPAVAGEWGTLEHRSRRFSAVVVLEALG